MCPQIKKRILFITPFCRPNVGGAETYLNEITEYLRKHSYFVYIITFQPITSNVRGEPLERRTNLEIHRYPWIGHNLFHKFESFPLIFNFLYLTPYLFMRSFLFMLRYRNNIDVIDTQGLNAAFVGKVLKKIFKKRTIMSIMSLYEFEKKPLLAKITCWVLSSANKIITESEKSKEEISGIGISENKIVSYVEWVDQDRFRPRSKEKCKRRLGWQEKFIILFVGRAIPIKGADTLIETAKKIDKNIYFAFVSDAGPQVKMLKKAARETENVIFVGGVEYKDLHWYYNATDIFVIPSRYEENVARTMIEAVCSGTPIVGSNQGAIPEVLDSSVAILVKPTVQNIQRSIEFLYDNPDELKKLTDNCRPYSLKYFSSENAKVIVNSYE